MDNAPIHKSKLFTRNIEKWQTENDLFVLFLPTYSPELNLIEILWRKIKYNWLDFLAFLSKDIGRKFNIQFV